MCDSPARNESHCYLFTFWVQPATFPKGVPYIYIYIDFGFSTKSVSPVFYTSEKYTCYTHNKFISVLSKCLKQATLQLQEGLYIHEESFIWRFLKMTLFDVSNFTLL